MVSCVGVALVLGVSLVISWRSAQRNFLSQLWVVTMIFTCIIVVLAALPLAILAVFGPAFWLASITSSADTVDISVLFYFYGGVLAALYVLTFSAIRKAFDSLPETIKQKVEAPLRWIQRTNEQMLDKGNAGENAG